MTISTLGIDIAKNTVQLHGVDAFKLKSSTLVALYKNPSKLTGG
jgi:hypothetical protein